MHSHTAELTFVPSVFVHAGTSEQILPLQIWLGWHKSVPHKQEIGLIEIPFVLGHVSTSVQLVVAFELHSWWALQIEFGVHWHAWELRSVALVFPQAVTALHLGLALVLHVSFALH